MIRSIFPGLVALALAPAAYAAVDIEEVTSPGGITAWLVEEDQIPFIALELNFKGGAVLDPSDKRGAVNMMAGLLEEGAGALDARGFAQAQEALAASYSFEAYQDGVSISARFLTENMDEALELLRIALTEPRFDPSAIERVRGQILSDLRFQATQPDEIAFQTFAARAFGNHPYGTSHEGTIASVTSLTRDDLVTAYESVLTLDKVHVGVVGDITADELGPILDALLDDLPASGPALPDRIVPSFDGGLTVVPFDTPQSVAVFGQTGLEWEDPDYFPAFVMMRIIGGGGFDSRLMEEVREKRGLTYGVYAYLSSRDYADVITGSLSSSNDRIAEAITVIRDIWQDIATNGVSDEDLEIAKTFMTGSYPLRFDGNGRIAGLLANMQADDFPIDYVLTRNDRVNAVTAEDVKRVAERLLQPDALTFVVVGQPEGLETTN